MSGARSASGAVAAFMTPRRRRRLSGYLVLAFALLLLGGGYALFGTPAKHAEADSSSSSFQVTKGRELYLRGCSSCHGMSAQGGELAPSLIGVGAAAVDFQVSTGRMPLKVDGIQPPTKKPLYDADEIAALSAYIASLGPGPAIPGDNQIDISGANVARGGELFRTNCAQCHNFTGQGGALSNGQYAPSLKDADARQIYEAMITGPSAMPVFSDAIIPANEKQDIIAYVEHMRNQADPGGLNIGRVGPVTEGLVAWIVGLVVIIGFSVWIGAKAKRA